MSATEWQVTKNQHKGMYSNDMSQFVSAHGAALDGDQQ